MEAQLELGLGENMAPSDFQKVMNAKKKPHDFKDHSQQYLGKQAKKAEKDNAQRKCANRVSVHIAIS